MRSFKIAINMAGAVSAGAYTAGVLDFLIEALDEWYAAKEAGEAVPPHDISIEAFSGASAGGMCAAISAAMTQEDFEHIHDTSRKNTSNQLYEAWVNQIDIRELLETDDLKNATAVPSLLDSNILNQIADYALNPRNFKTRTYISPHLTLFLTLTNLRGVPYALYEGDSLTPDEYVTFHADRLRFEMVDAGQKTIAPDAQPLPRGKADADVWPLLRTAAKATGAFPLFLAARCMNRNLSDYQNPMWESLCQCEDDAAAAAVAPSWPNDVHSPWTTVNVDGGITNNTPFTLAHDYLATLDPPSPNCTNEGTPEWADRAVITVAPFPGTIADVACYDPVKESSAFSVLPNLFSALISQSRFFGECLEVVTGKPTSSRFFIAPSDEKNPNKPALQCALLSAFGGFFERGFRAHDFELGRRNCQRFLQTHFLLPLSNPLFSDLQTLDEGQRNAILARFQTKPPGAAVAAQDEYWMPIIPLCGTAAAQAEYPEPAKITEASLDEIVGLISGRMKALLPILLANLRSGVLRFLIKWGTGALMTVFRGKQEIKTYLAGQLRDVLVK